MNRYNFIQDIPLVNRYIVCDKCGGPKYIERHICSIKRDTPKQIKEASERFGIETGISSVRIDNAIDQFNQIWTAAQEAIDEANAEGDDIL